MSEETKDTRLTDELLAQVKNYVDITWSDPDTDAKISGIILRAMSFLDHIAGRALEFKEEDTATQLLMDYVRYIRAGAAHSFPKDYQGELLALSMSGEVDDDGTDGTE